MAQDEQQNVIFDWYSKDEPEGEAREYAPPSPRFAGGYWIGLVDHVNGPASVETLFSISRYEAACLVRHWIEEIVDIDAMSYFHSTAGTSSMISRAYAYSRLDKLIAVGLISVDRVREIFDAEEKRRGIDWSVPAPIPNYD